jgi:MinD superfamily P-loop ATPase
MVMSGRAITIAVLSGKGGTGKTLVSVNLAAVSSEAVYVDCDVEEPNGSLFLKPEVHSSETVAVRIPEIVADRCTGCRQCVDFCAFNALAFVNSSPILFDEVCHACGGCALLCPAGAIGEKAKSVGEVFSGRAGNVTVHSGSLKIGEASGIPIIKQLMKKISGEEGRPIFVDCPPGSSCTTLESIQSADFCLLVAEPTVFGAHNLAMVFELAGLFGKPCGVVLNKCLEGEDPAETFCRKNGLPILGRIPFDHELGMLNSEGKVAARESDRFRMLFADLLERIWKEVEHEAASDS